MYIERNEHAYHGSQKQVMPPRRIPGLVEDYRRDRPGRADQPLQNERHSTIQNISCHQCHAHRHYSSDSLLPYARWKENIAHFKSLTMAIQERVPRQSMQLPVCASQVAKSHFEPDVEQIATAKQKRREPSRPSHILKRSDKRGKNSNSRRNQVTLLD